MEAATDHSPNYPGLYEAVRTRQSLVQPSGRLQRCFSNVLCKSKVLLFSRAVAVLCPAGEAQRFALIKTTLTVHTYEILGDKMREFSEIIEKDEDGYFVASVPALRGCHTQAKSLDTLMKRIKEAISQIAFTYT